MSLPTFSGRVVLGIETSCDETAVALVRDDRCVLAAPLVSQIAEHAPYGGVVPELAARAHVERLDLLIAQAMREAQLDFGDLAGVAASAGPGLIGGLIVGLLTGKAIAAVHGLPLIAVNHLEAHALTPRLTDGVAFPYLLLLVSGGHCQLLEVEGVGRYRRLGTTIDDAVGEAFDKVAKMLGLGYPGGPLVEKAAKGGDPARFTLPRPLLGQPGCNFSLSGLKTAVRTLILKLGAQALEPQTLADLCAGFQAAVGDVLVDRTRRAMALFEHRHGRVPVLVVAGGVAANREIGGRLAALAAEAGTSLAVPPPRLCTDNGVMVAWAGIERLALGLVDGLDAPARARWPLDAAAEPALGAGGKGHKA
ncbi:tRNA (adenosine(37)-N6)-threonylcarbamoyltransferase complex transferase subunit TsaD [Geminicoccaceae bacterium 1502E]|nr:tRNA (adenosine(37)-N6)-threonylcarbamoyltransferase complex transferase subunit TsaD [Geminicoccaceae bacterium 1502E]